MDMSLPHLLQSDMPKARVRNVTNKDPPDFEDTFPLIGRPDRAASGIVHLGVMAGSVRCYVTPYKTENTHGGQHLCHAAEMAAEKVPSSSRAGITRPSSPGVDAEEQVNWTAASILLESLVQSLVARVCGTPDLIFEGLMDIIFCIRFDHKVSSLATKRKTLSRNY